MRNPLKGREWGGREWGGREWGDRFKALGSSVLVLVAMSIGFLAVLLFVVLGIYVLGRILLPSVGLKAPGFETWAWVVIWSSIFGSVLQIIRDVSTRV